MNELVLRDGNLVVSVKVNKECKFITFLFDFILGWVFLGLMPLDEFARRRIKVFVIRCKVDGRDRRFMYSGGKDCIFGHDMEYFDSLVIGG